MTFVGKKNFYLCSDCGWGFVSVDVHEGTTPFMTLCRREGCGGMASSFMYRVPQELLAEIPAVVEWVAPTPEEYTRLSPGTQRHVDTFRLIAKDMIPTETT